MPNLAPKDILGRQVARYRKLRKISAEELAQRADNGLTRSIVANLENGRKQDVTTAQLMAIAYVLHVSPVDLLFDLRIPYAYVELIPAGDDRDEVRAPTWTMREWFAGKLTHVEMAPMVNRAPLTAAQASDQTWASWSDGRLARDIQRRSTLLVRANEIREKLGDSAWAADPDPWTPEERDHLKGELRDVHAELYELESALRSQKVLLEGPVHPDTRATWSPWL